MLRNIINEVFRDGKINKYNKKRISLEKNKLMHKWTNILQLIIIAKIRKMIKITLSYLRIRHTQHEFF